MTNIKNKFLSKFAVLAILFSLSLIINSEKGYSQGVGISNTAITPDPSAVLEMRSTNQGVLVPRMTTAQRDAIVAPGDGLMIYNTTTQAFNYFQGVWKSFSGVSNVTGSGNISSSGGATPNLTFTGLLPVGSGGTGIATGNPGGILGFTDAGTLASSPTLTSKALIIGGGAGATPSSLPLGTGNQVLGMNNAATGHEYKTINGTLNQINLTHGVNTVTFSTPQNIHMAATPTFAGLTLSGLNSNAFVYLTAGKSINTTAAPTNGQLLIGSTGVAPVVGNLTPGNGIAITNGAGAVTISNNIPVVEVSSSSATGITTTSTAFLTATGISISVPADGDYMAWFSSSMSNSNNKVNNISLFKVDGQTVQQILASERSSSTETICATQAYLPNLIAGQLIDLRWKVAGGTGTMYQSTLTLMKVR